MKHVSEWNTIQNTLVCTYISVNGRQGDDDREDEGAREAEREQERKRRHRARVRRVEGVMTRSAQDRGGDRGGSVSDRLLVAPLWRL